MAQILNNKAIIEIQSKWAQDVVSQAKSILLKNKKVATGALLNSIRYKVTSRGTIVFNYNETGKYVESGRRKNSRFPPPASILQWIRVKGIKGRSKDGRFISNNSLAFLIGRSIAKNGIKPLPFMKEAIAKSKKLLAPKLKKAVAKVAVMQFKDVLRKNK